MASANCTITAPVGAGSTVTAEVFNNVRKLEYDFAGETFTITLEDGVTKRSFDFETIATITHTISGEVSTVTITT